MSEFSSFDQAAEALAAAVGGGDAQSGTPESTLGNTATPYTPPEAQPNQPEQPGTTQGDQGTTQEQQFLDSKSIDLTQLDENSRSFLEAREREMQAAFTRKTQELAAQRAEAEQAMQFLTELNSNPEFAYEVSQRLSGELERLGYNQEAAPDPYAEVGDDPYLAKINELEQWKNQQEQRIREGEAASRIDRETAVIQAENPNWGEEDFNSVYGLALAHGGDIRAAAASYKAMTDRSIQRYLDQKASVPATFQNQPSQSGHAEAPPEGFTSVTDKRLHSAALERLRAEGYS
jgi:hypothetical protein